MQGCPNERLTGTLGGTSISDQIFT